jgi:hypothetical protein
MGVVDAKEDSDFASIKASSAPQAFSHKNELHVWKP